MENTQRTDIALSAITGALILIAPYYLEITGWWRWPFWILGGVFSIYAFASAVTREHPQELKDAVGNLAVGILLVVLAGGLAFAEWRTEHHTAVTVTLRIFVLLLVLFGCSSFLVALDKYAASQADDAPRPSKERRRDFARTVERVIVPLLSAATAVLVLVKELFNA